MKLSSVWSAGVRAAVVCDSADSRMRNDPAVRAAAVRAEVEWTLRREKEGRGGGVYHVGGGWLTSRLKPKFNDDLFHHAKAWCFHRERKLRFSPWFIVTKGVLRLALRARSG